MPASASPDAPGDDDSATGGTAPTSLDGGEPSSAPATDEGAGVARNRLQRPVNDMRSDLYFDDDAAPATDANGPLAPYAKRARQQRQRLLRALIVVFVLLALAALISILMSARAPAPVAEAPPAPTAPPPGAALPTPPGEARYPVAPSVQPLPPLAASDAVVLTALASVFGDSSLASYVERNNLIRRIVATVDNLPRRNAAPSLWPVKPAAGSFATTIASGKLTIAEHNAFRYTPYVRLLESVDTTRFVDFYQRHYPLFQQAYRELGYPTGHFNDRAIEVIDMLMATPSLDEAPRLTQPKVVLQFADRDLEQLPAGQKALLRIGPENAKRVQAKLAEIRLAIARPSSAAR